MIMHAYDIFISLSKYSCYDSFHQAWPDGASIQNKNEDTPLHLAAAYTSDKDIIELLLDCAPSSILVLNISGQSPVDRAKSNGLKKNIIGVLKTAADNLALSAEREGWGFKKEKKHTFEV